MFLFMYIGHVSVTVNTMDYEQGMVDIVGQEYLKRGIDVIKCVADKKYGVYSTAANKNSGIVFGYIIHI